VALFLGLAALLPVGLAQPPAPFNAREVKPATNVQDTGEINKGKNGIWVLNFRFKDLRLIKVNIPGRGQRVVWYLWYQVINRTGEPRTFIPDFELVTADPPGVSEDQVLPKAQEAIAAVEDPSTPPKERLKRLLNSVTIASEPIPVSKEESEAFPRAVTGVATWDNISPDANQYSVYISGLSNGWSVDDKGVVRRKTLQLNFRRVGDKYSTDSREIRFVGPAEWVYRASSLSAPKTGTTREPAKATTGMKPGESGSPAMPAATAASADSTQLGNADPLPPLRRR
jgi:hypothetical protein